MGESSLRDAIERLERVNQIVASLEPELREIAKDLESTLDSPNELGEADMERLSELMEKKNQLEQMISNVMKAASETIQGITQNLNS
jgi:uncharacterized protein (UPF0335 family)